MLLYIISDPLTYLDHSGCRHLEGVASFKTNQSENENQLQLRDYLTLLPCWIFWYHCTTAMLGAQPLLPGVRESPGISTLSDLRWAVARRVMSSKELLSALLCAVYPGIWGSSGINWRYLSSLLLKQSTLRLVKLRISGGRVLNSCCPWMGRLAYCSFWMDAGAACLTAGTMHSRLRRGCHFAVIFGVWSFVLSTFGMCPSRMRQIYILLYLSRHLSRE